MSLSWRLNKLVRKKRGGPCDTEALFDAQKNGAVGGDAVARRVETGRRVLHKGVTAGDGNPLGTLVAAEGRRRRMKKSTTAGTSADAQTRKRADVALGANVGGEFKSFTCSREISSSNQQRQF